MTCHGLNPVSIMLMRTHDPTTKMVQRIKYMQRSTKDTRWILSINLSINSFLTEANTDIIGYDADYFASNDQMMKSLPNLLIDKKMCFVKTNKGICVKNIQKPVKDDKSVSQGATLFRLKPNIIELLDTFRVIENASIHLYIDKDIVQRFGDLPRYANKPIAWNYHNECACLALESVFGNKDNKNSNTCLAIDDASRIWMFEDDVEYTGDIQEFLRINEARDFDLLGARSYMEKKDNPLIVAASTAKFKQMVSSHEKIHKYGENVICMSGRYVKMMIPLLNQGFNAMSEVSTIQYCYDAGMKYLEFESKYCSRQYAWCAKKEFEKEGAIEQYIEQLKQEKKSMLVHPCKF